MQKDPQIPNTIFFLFIQHLLHIVIQIGAGASPGKELWDVAGLEIRDLIALHQPFVHRLHAGDVDDLRLLRPCAQMVFPKQGGRRGLDDEIPT